MYRLLVFAVLLLSAGGVSAADYTISCSNCGSSNSGNSQGSLNALREFNGGFLAANGWKIGQTVRLNASDGSKSVYKKYSNHATIQFGCVSDCGPGDHAEHFVAPTAPVSGAGGYAPGSSNGAGSYWGVVGFQPVYTSGTSCVAGNCTTTYVLTGYSAIYGWVKGDDGYYAQEN